MTAALGAPCVSDPVHYVALEGETCRAATILRVLDASGACALAVLEPDAVRSHREHARHDEGRGAGSWHWPHL